MNIKRISCLIMDVDGTLTDGKLYIGNDNEIFKAFNIKDGYGIRDVLILSGIIPVVLTGRQSKIVENRCKELGITELYQGVKNKEKVLKEITDKLAINYSRCAYIGDDLNDLVCMRRIKNEGGFIGCPADAIEQVREIADFVSAKNGGEGAVREFIEWIVEI